MRKDFGVKTFLYPQPVLILATYNEDGTPNAMNAAWGGICDEDKVMIDLGPHRTTDNIRRTGAFTVAVGDAAHTAACDYVGIVSGEAAPDKVQKAGFTTVRSTHVNAPVINELPITLECVLHRTLEDGMIVGRIVNVSCDERYLGEDGLPDLGRFTPITYDPVHHRYIALGEAVGNAFADGKTLL